MNAGTRPRRGLTTRVLGLLAIVLVLSLHSCSCEREQEFKWRGKTWTIVFEKSSTKPEILYVVDPAGFRRMPTDFNFPSGLRAVDADIQLPPGAQPLSSLPPQRAAAPGGPLFVYLLDVAADDAIRIFRHEPPGFEASIALPAQPQGMVLSRDGRWLYVTHLGSQSGSPPPRVLVIDTRTRAIAQTVELASDVTPRDPVLSPDDRTLFVPNAGRFVAPQGYLDSSVILIDTARRQVAGSIPINRPGTGIGGLAITPDGALLFALPLQAFPARLFVIDTLTRDVATSTAIQGSFRHLLVNDTGSRLYLLTENSVAVIDTATTTEIARIRIGDTARLNRLALSLDGGSLFVNHEFTPLITRIDTSTNRIAEEIRIASGNADSSFLLVAP